MREMLLGTGDDASKQLKTTILERIEEGMGEAIMEIGFENNGDSMNLTLAEWNNAYERLQTVAKGVDAVCQLLLTSNVGGDAEAASTAAAPTKDKSCTGKVLLRRAPRTVEETIETRIAVVGNGSCSPARRYIYMSTTN